MMRPTINEESDCLRKKNLRRRQRSTNHSAKCNRRGKSVGSNWCRTCILYGCQLGLGKLCRHNFEHNRASGAQ